MLHPYQSSLYISSGFYNASSYVGLTINSSRNIFGECALDTIIYYTNSDDILFYSHFQYGASLSLANITYFPKFGSDQRLRYIYYGRSLDISDIIINGNNSDDNSLYDSMYCYRVDDIIVKNVQIYEMILPYRYLFVLIDADYIFLSDIFVTKTIPTDIDCTSSSNSVGFE